MTASGTAERVTTPAPAVPVTWQTAVINNAVKAATELDKKFPEVATQNNPALLLKNQGPSYSQYQALYALFSNPNILNYALNEKLDAKTVASLLRWHVDTSGVTLERKSSLEFVPTDAVSINIVGNTVNIIANLMIYGDGVDKRSQSGTYYLRELALRSISDGISGRYWIDGRWITVNMRAIDYGPLGHTTAPRGQNLVDVEIKNTAGISKQTMGSSEPISKTWSVNNPGSITLYPRLPGATEYISDAQFGFDSMHEIGHILGVGDAYDNMDDTGRIAPNAHRSVLHTRDIMRSGRYGRQFSAVTMGLILHAQATNQYQQIPR
jgi:hypothetical protein